jgi:hypothetical protein
MNPTHHHHSPLSSAKVKNEWRYNFTLLYAFIVWTGRTLPFIPFLPCVLVCICVCCDSLCFLIYVYFGRSFNLSHSVSIELCYSREPG